MCRTSSRFETLKLKVKYFSDFFLSQRSNKNLVELSPLSSSFGGAVPTTFTTSQNAACREIGKCTSTKCYHPHHHSPQDVLPHPSQDVWLSAVTRRRNTATTTTPPAFVHPCTQVHLRHLRLTIRMFQVYLPNGGPAGFWSGTSEGHGNVATSLHLSNILFVETLGPSGPWICAPCVNRLPGN